MDTNQTPASRPFSVRRGILYGLLGSGALATLFAARPIVAAVRDGGFHGRFGQHRMNPEAMHEHLKVGVKWALRDVDATEDQQARVGAILSGAMGDLHRLKEQHTANREEFRAQFAGAAVDREALERIRKSELALADEASRRLVQALGDAAEVLTPEQRKLLLERHGHHR